MLGGGALENKTLYVTDLDGTLLRSDKTLSAFSADTINMLIDKGVYVTYATARSHHTATEVTGGRLMPKIPVILYNGTFIASAKGEILKACAFDKGEASALLSLLQGKQIYPLVHSFFEGRERFFYRTDKKTRGIVAFLEDHKNDPRETPTNEQGLTQGEAFHLTCIDDYEKLLPIYEGLKKKHQCVLYKDSYTGEWWLEIMPRNATKANAIATLAKMLGCERIVCFGDGVNDISMGEVATELYAPKNAHPELLSVATGVLDTNDEDGVAKWLLRNAK
ncbi:MAG: HAD family hydrolase [Clostridia bacterium]|nr:HAD family hydrolase [Clostridia bacterium]